MLHANACRFVVVEDDVLLCDCIANVLKQNFGPAALHTFHTGRDALRHVTEKAFEVLVTDLALPDLDGRQIIRQASSREPRPRIVVLTGQVDAALPSELFSLGVAGFIDKSAPLEHAVRAVQRVLVGGMYFYANVMPMASVKAIGPRSGKSPEASVLSGREREVVRFVASGLTSKEIAGRLGLSTRTVGNHRLRLMRRIGVRDTANLVRWCLEHGLG